MPPAPVIVLGVLLLLSFLGWAVKQLKKTSEQREEDARREKRKQQRQDERESSGQATTFDRYMEEVDRQRRGEVTAKRATRPPVVPTVKPAAKKQRLADTLGTGFPEAKPVTAKRAAPTTDDLPTAAVVSPPGSMPLAKPARASAPPKPARASAPAKLVTAPAATPFAKEFTALLATPQSAALAVILKEVLGPPKCKQ